MTKRYLARFESADGSSYVYTFPLNRYEYEPSQGVISPRANLIGGDYAVRLLGDAKVIRDVGAERIRCVFVGTEDAQDDAADEARAKLYLGAYGKLWTVGDDASERWAWAELAEMPTVQITYRTPLLMPMIFGFTRFSDWQSETQITDTEAVTSDGQTWVVANPGTIAATKGTIRIRSSSGAGFDEPKITNETTGDEWEMMTVAASADDEVKLDTRVPSVEFSDDDGANYADAYADYVEPPVTQKLLSFSLAPGNNTLRLNSGGTVNCSVEIAFEAPFA